MPTVTWKPHEKYGLLTEQSFPKRNGRTSARIRNVAGKPLPPRVLRRDADVAR